MPHRAVLVAGWLTLAVAPVAGGQATRARSLDLGTLAEILNLGSSGVRHWLDQLVANAEGGAAERLLAVSLTGETLLARDGEGASVRIDPELDTLLRRVDAAVVLVHNHPASLGLSAADLRQLGKPGVVAIVVMGHNGSVFMASAGPQFDADFFEERQHSLAVAEVRHRVRAEWPSVRLPMGLVDAHFSHLVTLSLARARVVHYWFRLRGNSHDSFDRARVAFSRIVVGTSGALARTR